MRIPELPRSSGEDGQAVIEFALVLPLVLLILLGLVQFGFLLGARQQLADTARQGARAFALTADPAEAFAAVRIGGRQVRDFERRAQISLEVSRGGERRVHQIVARQERARFFGRRQTVTRYETVERTEFIDTVSFRVTGRPAERSFATGRARPGDWVTVVVSYAYPNPIRASAGGFRLAADIPITVRAVARVEAERP